jgi:hypothetical protein
LGSANRNTYRYCRAVTRVFVTYLTLLGIVMASAVGFLLVGLYARRPEAGEFDWELASIFGTAVGTLLLAVATGALAASTSRDVSATGRLAELAVADQVDRIRPAVIGAVDEMQGRTLRIKLRNVGLGPAVRVLVRVESEVADVGLETVDAIPAGETVEVELQVRPHDVTQAIEFAGRRIAVWQLEGNYTVSGQFLDRLGHEAGRILDWKHEALLTPGYELPG